MKTLNGLDVTANLAISGTISPSQITSDQNDYNPTGLSAAAVLRLSSDASRSITGLAGGAAGRVLTVHNVGSFPIVLSNASASSSASNRFALKGDLTLAPDDASVLQYDSTSNRWRCVGSSRGSADPGICNLRISLEPNVAVSTTDQVGKTNLCIVACGGNKISLYDGTANWNKRTVTNTTVALGTLVNAQLYDVFGYDTGSAPAYEFAEWSNATATLTIATPAVVTWTAHGLATGNSVTFTTSGALPTGVTANIQYWVTKINADTFKLSTTLANCIAGTFVATSGSQSGTHTAHSPANRQTAITTQDGIDVKTGATTRRLLGTFMTTSTTTTAIRFGGADSGPIVGIWNNQNRVRARFQWYDSTSSWNYTGSVRQKRASTNNQIEVVAGGGSAPIVLRGLALGSNGSYSYFCFSEDATDGSALQGNNYSLNTTTIPVPYWALFRPSAGYHIYYEVENAAGGNGTYNGGSYRGSSAEWEY